MCEHVKEEETKFEGKHDLQMGGGGLIEMILSTMEQISEAVKSAVKENSHNEESPMDLIEDSDLDDSDPVVQEFFNDGGCKGVLKIIRLNKPEVALEKLSEISVKLQKVRMANRRLILRQIFAAAQIARGIDNEAVNLERVAHKMTSHSKGFYQAESIMAIDSLVADTYNQSEKRVLASARDLILSGEFEKGALKLKEIYASALPQSQNIRTAYTTLRTQGGEPYLLCPKGIHVMGHAVPMEVSKCRENCIDSKVDESGAVSCQYQSWLKHADTHEKAMARLEVHRHPDNAENALAYDEGSRGLPYKLSDLPVEKRFEDSNQGSNKVRDKKVSDESIEARLEKAKSGQPGQRPGHSSSISDMNIKASSFNNKRHAIAQNVGIKSMEQQLRSESSAEPANITIEKQLETTNGYNGHRGEMEQSYAHQLANQESNSESITEQLLDQEEIGGVRVTERLASDVAEINPESKDTLGSQISEDHTNEQLDDFTIEELLADERRGLSEDEIDMLLEQLLEETR